VNELKVSNDVASVWSASRRLDVSGKLTLTFGPFGIENEDAMRQ
jgi:hypothetical protein